jgi:microcystin-dependent protein
MSQPYVGEIRMFGGNFAPAGWAFCAGQLIPISDNDVLFNLIGTTFGGDGQATFALPDLQGRAPMHPGPGFQQIGEKTGTETVTLTGPQLQIHSHNALTTGQAGTTNVPNDSTIFANTGTAGAITTYLPPGGAQQPFKPSMLTMTGGNQPHENMQPFLVVSFIISLFGIFPSQT